MLKQEQREQAESAVTPKHRTCISFRARKSDALPAEGIAAETDELEARLTDLQKAFSKRKRSRRRGDVGLGAVFSGLAVMRLSTLTENVDYRLASLAAAVGLGLGGYALMLASVLGGERACRKAVTAVANTDDLRAVGALAEALALGEPSYSLVVSALTRLLPRLQPSDAELLTDAQRARLQRTLRQSADRLVFWRYNPHFASVLRRALTTLDALPPEEQAAGPENLERTEAHPRPVDALLEQFQAAVRQRQKNTLTIGASASVAAGSAVGNIVVQTLTHQQGNTPLLSVAIGSIAVTLAFTFRGLFRLKAMMNELAGADDLRVVGPLLEIASIEDGHANTMAAHLLTRLLPRLKASDTTLLTDSQHAALGRTLTRNVKNADFLVAALAALEQVGDGRALPVVESLASGRIVTADPLRVRAAAHDCLPYLQTRYAQRQASQTLLRASALSETPCRYAPQTGAGRRGHGASGTAAAGSTW